MVPAPVSLTRDVAGGGQFRDDAMRGAFSDPRLLADVAQADAAIVRESDQHLGVIGQKRPAGFGIHRHPRLM